MTDKKWQYLVNKDNFNGIPTAIVIDDEILYGFGKTVDDYIAKGYTLMEESEYITFLNDYEKSICGDWQEITEEEYTNVMYVLPPIRSENGGFFACEAYMNALHQFYQEYNGKYYTALESLAYSHDYIMDSLKKYIENQEQK